MNFRMGEKIMIQRPQRSHRSLKRQGIGSPEETAPPNSMLPETSQGSLDFRLLCTYPMKAISGLGAPEQWENKFVSFEPRTKLLVVLYSRDKKLIHGLKPALAGIRAEAQLGCRWMSQLFKLLLGWVLKSSQVWSSFPLSTSPRGRDVIHL